MRLGRRVEYYDQPAVRAIVKKAAQNDYRFSSFVLGIVNSPAFQMSKAEPVDHYRGEVEDMSYDLTKKHLSRRAVLKGMGVTVALPFLDAMVPAGTVLAKTAAAARRRRSRLICMEMVHGSAGATPIRVEEEPVGARESRVATSI